MPVSLLHCYMQIEFLKAKCVFSSHCCIHIDHLSVVVFSFSGVRFVCICGIFLTSGMLGLSV